MPAIAAAELRVMPRLVRIDLRVHEVAQPRFKLLYLRRIIEIHAAPLSFPSFSLYLLPTQLRERPRPSSRLDRALARSVACDRARHDALQNRREAKHVVGHIEGPVGRRWAARLPGPLEIHLQIL